MESCCGFLPPIEMRGAAPSVQQMLLASHGMLRVYKHQQVLPGRSICPLSPVQAGKTLGLCVAANITRETGSAQALPLW